MPCVDIVNTFAVGGSQEVVGIDADRHPAMGYLSRDRLVLFANLFISCMDREGLGINGEVDGAVFWSEEDHT